LAETPSMPQSEGEIYYIISMGWFKRWKIYTFYDE
jgi:hypothetical protein